MKLAVISHKTIWTDPNSTSGFVTTGGFPFQIQAVSELFDLTIIMVPVRPAPPPSGTIPLKGKNLHVFPLNEPSGRGLRRKIAMLFWLPRYLPNIWQKMTTADAVHALVPGDIGLIGILVGLAQRKPLFVRHCGTWGEPVTLTDHFLIWLLERIAGGRNIVMATGGGESLPSNKNQDINWVFSTTLTCKELVNMSIAKPWQPGKTLRLVTVSRLTPGKNVSAVIRALPIIQKNYPATTLEVIGDGEKRPELEHLVSEMDLKDSVNFHGNITHARVLDILSRSHLFLFPTQIKEGFPKALLEAMASSLPSVASSVSVIPLLLGDECGILINQADQRSLAKAVLSLISNPKRMSMMGSKSRQVAMDYSLEQWRDLIGKRLSAQWGILNST